MTAPLTRPRKARILEKAGLRHVSGWLPIAVADAVQVEMEAAEKVVDAALKRADAKPWAPRAGDLQQLADFYTAAAPILQDAIKFPSPDESLALREIREIIEAAKRDMRSITGINDVVLGIVAKK